MSWVRIEITSGILSGPARTYCGGNLVAVDFSDTGKLVFFVEAVEADGGRFVLHDSLSYAAAMAEAEAIACAEGIPVRDPVAGGA